ncbi:putative negative regulation of gluconeogenesis-related protein [Kockovaella imperatae]|uniref:Putative negative regulation of gluconeogenesis-related protein n=1 Tax=Kockovaella imperatae TaxID=4999 RepID=A0A1Y1UF51_9TREE|nr:putative negative regulation of gluconeogenesis-related protein [Kockovaella imperatae]ORX36619.1 putative negative regulation of gluconeogenesis-related protein [Kockovaella imperatae]
MPAGPPGSSSGQLILEEPLIRTPYELLRRSHRSAQRQVEKDFKIIQSGLNDLVKRASTAEPGPSSHDSVIKQLDQVGERVKGLKRKLDDLQPREDAPSVLKSRLKYVESLGKGEKTASEHSSLAPPETEAGTDRTLDRYIVDYLLRTGRVKAAQALAVHQGIEDYADIKLFAELTKIEKALIERRSVTEALAWCGENRGTLKKTKNDLEFALRLQEFIELCRHRDVTGAITYSRKNLAAWAPTHMQEIQQGMTLLVFGERTGVSAYRKLYETERWQHVRHQFRETFLNLYGLPTQPLLALALSAGLSSLRLPSCAPHVKPSTSPLSPKSPTVPLLPSAPSLHDLEQVLSTIGAGIDHLTAPIGGVPTSPEDDMHEHPETLVGNVDCPTCGEDMKILASEVPMSHHVNSTIVCRISGKVMDSQNEPMAFPNGHVYSSKALEEMANSNFGCVTCPRTRQTTVFTRLRKVYIS